MRFRDITIQNLGKGIKTHIAKVKEADAKKQAEAKAVRDMYNEQLAVAKKKFLAIELNKQAKAQALAQAKAQAIAVTKPQPNAIARFLGAPGRALNQVAPVPSQKVNNQLKQSMQALMGGGNPVMNSMIGKPAPKQIERKLSQVKAKKTTLNINGTKIVIETPQMQNKKKVNALKSQIKKGSPNSNKELNDLIWKL